MARSVFFDPFGSALQGYNTGIQQEQNLQQNARNARQTDWQYNNVNPIALSNMQLDNQYARALQPYKIQAAPYYLYNSQADYATRAFPGAITAGLMTGDPNAAMSILNRAYGYNFSPTGNGNYQAYFPGPNGEMHPTQTFNGSEFLGRSPEAWQRGLGAMEGQVGLLNADANLAMAPYRGMYYYGRGAGDLYRGEGYLGREQAQYGNNAPGTGWGTGAQWATGFNPPPAGGQQQTQPQPQPMPAGAAPYFPGISLPQQ